MNGTRKLIFKTLASDHNTIKYMYYMAIIIHIIKQIANFIIQLSLINALVYISGINIFDFFIETA